MQVITKQQLFQLKKEGATTRERKSLAVKENGRSTDFIIPSFAIGCELNCFYCYVARNRNPGNPLEIFSNQEELLNSVIEHFNKLGTKQPNQCDPKYWTYDIGESTDCLTPKVIDITNWWIKNLLLKTNAKPSFATKCSNLNNLVQLPSEYSRRARVRFSLMPEFIRQKVEWGTSSIDSRIRAIQTAYDLGYEVHINLSPVIGYKNWLDDYDLLLKKLDNEISHEVKSQLKAEVICLTHHEDLHNFNLLVDSEAEMYLWKPQLQEFKINNRGGSAIRYKYKDVKPYMIDEIKKIFKKRLPYCSIRYIF